MEIKNNNNWDVQRVVGILERHSNRIATGFINQIDISLDHFTAIAGGSLTARLPKSSHKLILEDIYDPKDNPRVNIEVIIKTSYTELELVKPIYVRAATKIESIRISVIEDGVEKLDISHNPDKEFVSMYGICDRYNGELHYGECTFRSILEETLNAGKDVNTQGIQL
ncbi:MAG: hypothetical protein ACRCXX_12825 [Cetobacterium sp.]|uniref:hypothetical protein n=1 Tax=Cetobacterium sp. TaxID=2071632 RepID=UPI003F35B922